MNLKYINGAIIITPENCEFPILKKWIKKWGNKVEVPFMEFFILLKKCHKARRKEATDEPTQLCKP